VGKQTHRAGINFSKPLKRRTSRLATTAKAATEKPMLLFAGKPMMGTRIPACRHQQICSKSLIGHYLPLNSAPGSAGGLFVFSGSPAEAVA
jgi:hypothetical protein